ncbi:MAG: glycosyltransferase family 4 protein [Candidatus Eisenbacteria bacterium]|uniref:Glycosyltransferase family 4 protein n=1 Tax=Eiseniibacteriota bacterium TaxID=2212470 RepID=A0A849SLR4_UNCEI|nr:glycosyltransferase family 4 protein [Candidatus Eisenbacteria bacterium]
MKIAMIGQKGVPATYGGIERHVEEIAVRLGRSGHDVSAFCRLHYTPEDARLPGVHLLRRPSIHTKHLDTASHVLWSTVEAMLRPFDIVHFHALGPSALATLPRLTGSRTVVTVHGLDWQRQKWGRFASWVLKQCEGPAAHFPNRTIVVSKTLRQYFKEHHHCDAVFIPNGTHLPQPRPARKLASLGLTPGKYVLFVGRLVPEKGVHFLCEAFSRIDSDMTLALVGGLSFTQDYLDQLKRFEGPRVRFLDYMYGEMLEELWSNAYVVVQPSILEGLSIALLEALSYGRCVLMSDIPENREVAEECAAMFQSQNVDDLERQLRMLLEHPEVVRRYESQARGHIAEHFSWDKVAASTEAVYRELLATRR